MTVECRRIKQIVAVAAPTPLLVFNRKQLGPLFDRHDRSWNSADNDLESTCWSSSPKGMAMKVKSKLAELRSPIHLLLDSTAIGIGVVALSVFRGPIGAQQAEPITVQSGRPLAEALHVFEQRYGWIITYEDPRYEHESDIVDVTESVRRDGNLSQRVLVPRGGTFSFQPAVPPSNATAGEVSTIIGALLDAYHSSGNAGVFRLQNTGTVFHVSPYQIKGRSGYLTTQASVLDEIASIGERKERSVYNAMSDVLDSVSAATGRRLLIGMVPINLLARKMYEDGATPQPARELLTRILGATGFGLSWQLFYDPGLGIYMFNVHVVTTPTNG
jgi:hypothetical protein